MITFKFARFTFVAYVSHTVNEHVTDIILNIVSQEHLTFTLLQIVSRLFELFSKEVHVRVKKQTGMSLSVKHYGGGVKVMGILLFLTPERNTLVW